MVDTTRLLKVSTTSSRASAQHRQNPLQASSRISKTPTHVSHAIYSRPRSKEQPLRAAFLIHSLFSLRRPNQHLILAVLSLRRLNGARLNISEVVLTRPDSSFRFAQHWQSDPHEPCCPPPPTAIATRLVTHHLVHRVHLDFLAVAPVLKRPLASPPSLCTAHKAGHDRRSSIRTPTGAPLPSWLLFRRPLPLESPTAARPSLPG